MSDRGRILAVSVVLLAAVVFASGARAVADRTSGRIPTTGIAQHTAPAIASAYNALPPSLAGRDVRLPLWRNGHTKSGLTTGIAVTNVSEAQADVTITFAASGNDVATFTTVLAPRATHYWWPPDHPELALGFRSA